MEDSQQGVDSLERERGKRRKMREWGEGLVRTDLHLQQVEGSREHQVGVGSQEHLLQEGSQQEEGSPTHQTVREGGMGREYTLFSTCVTLLTLGILLNTARTCIRKQICIYMYVKIPSSHPILQNTVEYSASRQHLCVSQANILIDTRSRPTSDGLLEGR